MVDQYNRQHAAEGGKALLQWYESQNSVVLVSYLMKNLISVTHYHVRNKKDRCQSKAFDSCYLYATNGQST